mgnify:CR=1 FL=1
MSGALSQHHFFKSAMNQLNEPKSWYVLSVRPGFEKRIESNLKKGGIEVYLPIRKVVRQWSDRKKKIIVPLFSGYLFCRVSNREKYQVLIVNGVSKFVCVDGTCQASVIPNEEIEMVRILEQGKPEISNEPFYEGEEIKIVNGPFNGMSGVLIMKKGTKRLLVNIISVGHSVTVDISPYEIEKVKRKHQVAC